ncbi:MAG TPA: anti-sigma factor [Rhodanobacteraceae bacterium]|jgi:anti-sigma-K factor RskA
MNTPLDHTTSNNGSEDLRYAEYVLGVLDADARAAVEREIAADPHAAAEIARWQQYLFPLAEDIADAVPPDYLWARIQGEIGAVKTPQRPAPTARSGWWNSLSLWRGFAFGAAAVALACIIALVVLPRASFTPSAAPTVAYMAATITQNDGRVGWTAIMDLQRARMIVVPAQPQNLPANRVPELWLIPAGQKPIAVGMIAASGPITIPLDKTLLARLGPSAALAVSVEPPGGSPTGQPTGPVIAKGSISAPAQQAAGKPVALVDPGRTAHSTT